MNDSTVKILDVTLRADSSVTPAERNRILKVIRGGELLPVPNGNSTNQPPKIYSRTEAARLLGQKSTRYIDLLTRKKLLQKFTAPGSRRAIGVTSQSLEKFLAGGVS